MANALQINPLTGQKLSTPGGYYLTPPTKGIGPPTLTLNGQPVAAPAGPPPAPSPADLAAQELQTSLQQINKAFSTFTPDFYTQRQNDYINYAMPQLADQYKTTSNNLDYQLADRGLTNSSAAQNERAALTKQENLSEQNIANTGLSQAQTLQQQIQGQKNQLVEEASTATQPLVAGQQALSTAQSFTSPSVFQPIGQAFTDFSNQYLANQNASALAPYVSSLYAPSYNNKAVAAINPLPSNQ